ncbi:CdaR family protein [Bacillus taeanensis]|uniref:YbbR-like domain-containing protein n=1 Tax=Bacillus taeanensis TaxID=273032 RepID=A0A366XUI4_9BACI|nr:CdaR family protein [Bacillus taeanensis]RBW67803.1 YbbR-like domain-containing protein [Bacillus taeanensis]
MDKFLKSNWFLKIISFLLALMLYTIVGMSENPSAAPNPTSPLPKVTEGTEIIKDVELVPYYDQERYIISGLPATVDVELEGSNNQIIMEKLKKNFEVYVDLQNLTPGKHTVRLKHKDFSDELEVRIDPSSVNVTIDEKKTKDFPIDIDLINETSLPEGYTAEEPIATPTTVTVTGTDEQLNQIGFIKGFIDVKSVKETITKTVPINVFDINGNEIQGLQINPSVIDVKVPIKGPNKTVPLKVSTKGSLKEGFSIQSLEIEPREVTVFGSKETLEEIEYIDGITIDLSSITSDTTLELEIPLPKDVKTVDPKKVKATIQIGKQETRTFENIPIKVTGLPDGFEFSFSEPESGFINLELTGAASILEKLEQTELEAYVDVSELSEGEHDVPVELNSPQYITWTDNNFKAKLVLTNGRAG